MPARGIALDITVGGGDTAWQRLRRLGEDAAAAAAGIAYDAAARRTG
jgi:hypothetical protein